MQTLYKMWMYKHCIKTRCDGQCNYLFNKSFTILFLKGFVRKANNHSPPLTTQKICFTFLSIFCTFSSQRRNTSNSKFNSHDEARVKDSKLLSRTSLRAHHPAEWLKYQPNL